MGRRETNVHACRTTRPFDDKAYEEDTVMGATSHFLYLKDFILILQAAGEQL